MADGIVIMIRCKLYCESFLVCLYIQTDGHSASVKRRSFFSMSVMLLIISWYYQTPFVYRSWLHHAMQTLIWCLYHQQKQRQRYQNVRSISMGVLPSITCFSAYKKKDLVFYFCHVTYLRFFFFNFIPARRKTTIIYLPKLSGWSLCSGRFVFSVGRELSFFFKKLRVF